MAIEGTGRRQLNGKEDTNGSEGRQSKQGNEVNVRGNHSSSAHHSSTHHAGHNEHFSTADHRPSDSNGKSGRFSWVKKLMNNGKSGNWEEKRRYSDRRPSNEGEISSKSAASSKKVTVDEGSLKRGNSGLGKSINFSLDTNSSVADSGLDDVFSGSASVRSIKSGKTASAGRAGDMGSFISNGEGSVLSDGVSTRPLYSLHDSDLEEEEEKKKKKDTDTEEEDDDDEQEPDGEVADGDEADGDVEDEDAANGEYVEWNGPSSLTAETCSTNSSPVTLPIPGHLSYGSAIGGTTTPLSLAPRSLTQIGDAASVVTLASSTRNRRRRRSIDTNASTTAIPPASIMERIAGTSTPASSSLKGLYMSTTTSSCGNETYGNEGESVESYSVKS
ncbi:DEKNAAC104282 [Brettanomyces naardenensis]|uniref:DEKNAAC104282 n=1 Tax=Brettanomyces naardenensis TaxID=13370 RepID=A0A448YQE6_BRENA|nr:DEKNAAC104282 [Brettanomyces naardenensis]